MRPRNTIARAALLLLCAAVFAGTAFAGDKPKDGAPGNSGDAPGQQKKAEEPAATAAQTPPGQAKKADRQAAKAEKKQAKAAEKPAKAQKTQAKAQKKQAKAAQKPAKPARQSGSYKATSSGTDLKRGMDHKHTICHATGSATNPYVVITPSISGVFNGHMGHQDGDDIIPPFTYKGVEYSQNWPDGQAVFANGCKPVTAAQTTTAQTTTTTTTTTEECPPTTRTITKIVKGGVMHKTGSKTKPYVFIRPAKGSAHYTKHADDMIIPDQVVTQTIEVPGTCDEDTTTTVTLSNETVTLAGTTTTLSGNTVTIPGQTVTLGGTAAVQSGGTETIEEAGGVLGAQSPPPAGGQGGEEAGGVLDAVASLGETAVTGTLPFTGIPLWVAALVGGGLLAAGFALRRTT